MILIIFDSDERHILFTLFLVFKLSFFKNSRTFLRDKAINPGCSEFLVTGRSLPPLQETVNMPTAPSA